MKKIYIVLTHTGTVLSRIIKVYTKDEFSHVSIALDKDLKQMYSFGRLNPYMPFPGGFVHEYMNSGTFERFKTTKAAIYSLNVKEEEYEKIYNAIKKIQNAKEPYKFNIIGLFAIALKLRIHKEHSFYCAEFVKYSLESSGIETNLPVMIRPENFKSLKNIKLEYKGTLKNYRKTCQSVI